MFKKLLFLDFECASTKNGLGKIFSAGYVLTDLDFNILDKKDLVCNPESTFDIEYALRKGELKVAYTQSYLLKCPTFPYSIFPRLVELIDEETLVVGFSFANDLKFLSYTLNRYSLKLRDFAYLDVQKLFSTYDKSYHKHLVPGLDALNLYFNTGVTQDVHRSDEDSYMTMLVLESILDCIDETIETLYYKLPYLFKTFNSYVKAIEKTELQEIGIISKICDINSDILLDIILKLFSEAIFDKYDVSQMKKKKYYALDRILFRSDVPRYLKLVFSLAREGFIYDRFNYELLEHSQAYNHYVNPFLFLRHDFSSVPSIFEVDPNVLFRKAGYKSRSDIKAYDLKLDNFLHDIRVFSAVDIAVSQVLMLCHTYKTSKKVTSIGQSFLKHVLKTFKCNPKFKQYKIEVDKKLAEEYFHSINSIVESGRDNDLLETYQKNGVRALNESLQNDDDLDSREAEFSNDNLSRDDSSDFDDVKIDHEVEKARVVRIFNFEAFKENLYASIEEDEEDDDE